MDFGCGCGRVLRYWSSMTGPRLYGVDYNTQLIDWCQRYLPFAEFHLNHLYPPLTFDEEMFDVIYAISVFTQMSAELQSLWLQELKRILKRGGYLFFTTHGESSYLKLTKKERKVFDTGQVVVRFEEASGMNLCNAYHPQRYVQEKLAQGFAVKRFIPAGEQGAIYQDAYLMRKD